ncbi:MAG: IS1634 family transposase [Actinomycetia bacterium]|nr:IS1634 family transposase [Actinomycetes bacterium]
MRVSFPGVAVDPQQIRALAVAGRLDHSSASLRHLPLVRDAITELGIDDVINQLLPPDPRMKATDADCVRLMILNVLHGRVALYKMADWLAGTDSAVVLGAECKPSSFTDTRLGETLDRLFNAGVDDVLSAWASGYLASDSGPTEYEVHTDTTTLKLQGAYLGEVTEPAPQPARGHSKDHRPDLKQLVYGLSLQGAVGVPLCVSVLDGNAPDQTANQFHLDRLAGLLPPQHDVTFVADAKLCDAVSIGRVLDADFHLITLVPRSFTLRYQLVDSIRDAGIPLPVIGEAHRRLKGDKVRHYRGQSFIAPFKVTDPESGETQLQDMRFVVVESPGLTEREEGATLARLKKEHDQLTSTAGKLAKQEFTCESDARAAVLKAIGSPRLHDVDVAVKSEVKFLKRARRGRPKKDDPRPRQTVWRGVIAAIRVNDQHVEVARHHRRHFVLVTDHLDQEAWPDRRVLAAYRQQQVVEGHTGFRWLKGPAEVAPVFLNTPRRIAALGLVFVLALVVRNFIEHAVRSALAADGATLPNLNRQKTARPSAENVFYYFRDVRLHQVLFDGAVVHSEIIGLTEAARTVLELLGVPIDVFLPGPRKRSRSGWRNTRM